MVLGEGEDDPKAHPQLYDDRGRPYNTETRRINKDVIRSHNEVMQVIGVAEPENSASDIQAENRNRQQAGEDLIGRRLLSFGRAMEVGGVWGVNGLRQRVLVSTARPAFLWPSLLTTVRCIGNTRKSRFTTCTSTNDRSGRYPTSS